VELRGIELPKGAEEKDYGGIYPGNNFTCWMKIAGAQQSLIISDLRVFYPTTGFRGMLFRSWGLDNTVNMINCFIYMNVTEPSINNGVMLVDYGEWMIQNCIFHDLSFENYGIVRFNNEAELVKISLINNTFRSITVSSDCPAVVLLTGPATLNMTSALFISVISIASEAQRGSVLDLYNHAGCTLVDLSFVDVTGPISALFFRENFTYEQSFLVFTNVTAMTVGGGGLNVNALGDYSFTLIQCVFSLCSGQGKGGMMLGF
jgi:hypothetical protein